MATFGLIYGGGGTAWDWHLVVPELRRLGHDAVAVELPSEDETAGWREYGYPGADGQDDDEIFYHDLPKALADEAKRRSRNESSRALREPWPLAAWPSASTAYLVCRDDRMFPPTWARAHARERLGIEADVIDGGHYVPLSRPHELAARLHAYSRAD